ncbi:hypothetical protein FKW77_008641 [Venturia effusa]|uniref:Uncharacterized protein n=1 Tax=Venturia effusa TaxID=50376 RepID=A0A517LCS0_9PEZI|nr:hypothetical protein FKW77_008641 [Venturia effusa]
MSSSNHSQPVENEDHSARKNAMPMSTPVDTPKSFKKALRQCIDNLKKRPVLSSQHHVEAFPDPGLIVDEIGPIPLPLYSTYMNALLEKSLEQPAQSWSIKNNSFQLENPAWKAFIARQIECVAESLKMEGPASVSSCSLVLHRADDHPSDMAKACRTTAPGSFATLAIVLPSQHQSGHIRVSYEDCEEVLQTAAASRHGLTSLAWYADTTVDYQPLATGSRLMLVYSLNDDSKGQQNQSPVSLEASKVKLQHLLGIWSKGHNRRHGYQRKYLYILDKECGTAALSENALDEPDKSLVKQINGFCSPNGFHTFLTQMEMRKIANPEEASMDGYWEEEKDELELDAIYTLQGAKIAGRQDAKLSGILQEHPFARTPDDTERQSPDSNNFSATPDACDLHIDVFYDTVAVIVPTAELLRLFKHSRQQSDQVANFVAYVCQVSLQNPGDLQLQDVALQIMARSLQLRRGRHKIHETIAQWSLASGKTDSLRQTIEANISRSEAGVHAVFEIVADRHGSLAPVSDVDWQVRLGIAVSKTASLKSLQKSLLQYENAISVSSHQAMFNMWALTVIEQRLIAQDEFAEGDIPAIIQLIEKRGVLWASETFLPLLSNRISDVFLSKLLTAMFMAKSKSNIELALTDFYRHFMLERTAMFALQGGTFDPAASDSNISAFEVLLNNSLSLGLYEELHYVIETSQRNITEAKGTSVHFSLVIPLISTYISITAEHQVFLPAGRHLVILLLYRANKTYTRLKPERPADWQRLAKGCGACAFCNEVVEFLADPESISKAFEMGRDDLDHVFKYVKQAHVKIKPDRDSKIRPFPLIFTKTTFEYDAEMKTWAREFLSFQQAWKALDNDVLRQMTGERYEELVLLKTHKAYFSEHPGLLESVATPSVIDPSPNLVQSRSSVAPTVRKQASTNLKKRKSGLIDLEEEMSLRKNLVQEKRWQPRTFSRGERKGDPLS